MIGSAIKVKVAIATPSENVAKLELHPSVTHIRVVVFLSTLKLLYPRYSETQGISRAKKLL